MTSTDVQVPVLISGAGPVGMTLALELARYDIPSMLAERNPTTTKHPKMDLTNGRSMELYRRLGVAEKLRDAGVARENDFDISWLTSLVGHELHRFQYPSANRAAEIIREKNDGNQASEAGLRVSQIVIEPVLMKEVMANPLIDVRTSTSFERIEAQDDAGVTSILRDRTSNEEYRVRSSFLAGCDGGGSRVREAVGIALDGDFEVASAYMVHFRSSADDILKHFGLTWHLQSGSGTIIAQNDVDTYTLQRWLLPDENPDEMNPEDVLQDWVGAKFDFEILQANPWSAHLVVAESFRSGQRIALAGDSAHQVIPTGGYGMNSGVGDAIGLAWALAANVQGWGGLNLINAYDEERRNAAWWFNAGSRSHMAVRMEIGELYATAGDIESDTADAEANRKKLANAIAEIGNAENESWGIELGYRYDTSPAIIHESDAPAIDKLTYKGSTVPGGRFPHVFLDDGETSIHDVLGTYFTLAVFSDADVSAFEQEAGKLNIPLKVVRITDPNISKIYEKKFVLVRPDQHVAWRDDALPEDPNQIMRKITGN